MTRQVGADEFRELLAAFASGVAVVATAGPGDTLYGFTATAFTSVSLEPPLVLVCLAAKTGCFPAFAQTKAFTVSVLSAEQRNLALRFGARGAPKFAGLHVGRSEHLGLPLVPGATMHLECTVYDRHSAGDHLILIGKVVAGAARPEEPLVYHRRAFGRFVPYANPATFSHERWTLMNASSVQPETQFTRWLFRAYLDLGPVPENSPHHLYGLDFGIRALMEDRPYPRIQSALNPSFRTALHEQTRTEEYRVSTPEALPRALRTERWQALCNYCRNFRDLSSAMQVRLAWLLGKLCFQDYVLDLLPASVESAISQNPEAASLAYIRAYARYRMNLDDRHKPYSIEEFSRIALEAPPGIARIDATYQMVVQNVKHHNDVELVESWQKRHLMAIESSRALLDDFTYPLVMSRYHRVGGFIPQMRRDKDGTVAEMELSEQFALALPRRNDVEKTAADEMLYPVLESRTKEAIWIGDLDLALDRAKRTTALSPNDARAWLHLGQVMVDREDVEGALDSYRRAARLSPPGREIACFMAGQCYEAMEELEAACDAYLVSLDSDPLGIAAAERLHEVAGRLGYARILEWASTRLQDLRSLAKVAEAARAEPYKHLPPPEARSEARHLA